MKWMRNGYIIRRAFASLHNFSFRGGQNHQVKRSSTRRAGLIIGGEGEIDRTVGGHTTACTSRSNTFNSVMEGDCMKTVLITANVGSIFEEPKTMFPEWLKAFFQCIQSHKPGLVALHCQEVGGKNYEASMQHVNHFIKTLLACEELHKYDRARVFLDEDYTASDKFTALGNLYFIHEEVPDVLIWDFVECKFIEVEGREVLSGNIENVPIKEKAKFPQYFFPEFKWSRKGFLRTRWSINNCIFDLVNIHLFHDASNIVAMETSPSVYSENRQRAMLHTLQRFENDKYSKVPLFMFGDFNFRLDSNLLIQELAGKLVACQTKGKKGQVNKIEYTEEGNGKIVLTIGSKSFDYHDKHSDLFSSMYKWLQQYDSELSSFRDRLYEHEVTFSPSYPFCEDVSDGKSYMKTRVPSWCDRILLTHSARDILIQDPCHPIIYDLIGKDVCMGDHKPAYLFVHMKPGKGNIKQQQQSLSASSTTKPLPSLERKRTLSVNGELIETVDFSSTDVDLSSLNIHDFAVFEKEQNLIQEFRDSIKNRQSSANGDSTSIHNLMAPSQPKVARNRSFQEIAKEVITMEKVILQWPGRPNSRHHSSSSEDFPSEECDVSVSSKQVENSDVSVSSKQVENSDVSVSSKQVENSDVSVSSKQVENSDVSVSSKQVENSDGQSGSSNSDTANLALGKIYVDMKEINVQKNGIVSEANNNKNSELFKENVKPIEILDTTAKLNSNIRLEENKENRVGLDRSGGAVTGTGQLEGCGGSNGRPTGVVVLAEHDGHVHVDLSAPPPTSSPPPHCQSGGKEGQSGKTGPGISAPFSSPTGCCTCVVL